MYKWIVAPCRIVAHIDQVLALYVSAWSCCHRNSALAVTVILVFLLLVSEYSDHLIAAFQLFSLDIDLSLGRMCPVWGKAEGEKGQGSAADALQLTA